MGLGKLALLLLLATVSVGNRQVSSSSQQPIPSDTVISLERRGCGFWCPVYKLTIYADGKVEFKGGEHVKKKGVRRISISQEKLRQLIAEFEKANYFSLKERYEEKEDGCPEVWTDYSYIVTSIRINGLSKSISHYHGCQENMGTAMYQKGLTDLENKIDEIVGTQQWIK